MSERRYAVLIASSQYPGEPKLQDLRCPENDADGLNQIFTSKVYGEFTETFVLKNRPHHEVLLKINQVLKRADKNDLVLLYYSGHGKLDPAGRLHLATVDTVISTLEATSIPVESIRNYTDVSPSTKIILILDCCFSGAVDKAFLRSGVDDQLQMVSGGRGTYIMTASTGIQAAQEKEGDQYGIFTKHILEGIREGKADLDGNGVVGMDELYRYVHDRVLEEGFQEPMKWDLNIRGELVIARTGKSPRQERRRQIREILLDMANKGILPDRILSKAMDVIAQDPTQLSEKLKSYDALLDRLLQQDLGVGDFLEEWYKLESKAPATVVEKKRVARTRPAGAERKQPIPKELLPYLRAVGVHLLFGVGLFYVNRKARRRWVYPVFPLYALFDAILGPGMGIEPFESDEFGFTTFIISLCLYLVSFIDVLLTCRRGRRNLVG